MVNSIVNHLKYLQVEYAKQNKIQFIYSVQKYRQNCVGVTFCEFFYICWELIFLVFVYNSPQNIPPNLVIFNYQIHIHKARLTPWALPDLIITYQLTVHVDYNDIKLSNMNKSTL